MKEVKKQTLNNFKKETINKPQTIKGGPEGTRGTTTTVKRPN